MNKIFNSEGSWVAYIVNENVFSSETNEWIGWIENDCLFSIEGEYKGKVLRKETQVRVVRRESEIPPISKVPHVPPVPPVPPIPPIPPTPKILDPRDIDIFDSEREFL
jgi:hypothetical protein